MAHLTKKLVLAKVKKKKTLGPSKSGPSKSGSSASDPADPLPTQLPYVASPPGPLDSADSSASFVPETNPPLDLPQAQEPQPGAMKSWANIVKGNRTQQECLMLPYFPPNGKKIVIDKADFQDIEARMGFCLVGLFAGRYPGNRAVDDLIKRWPVPCKFFNHASGWIVFRFNTEEDRRAVFHGGPYSTFGRNLILKIMPRDFNFSIKGVSVLPLWVQFPSLPLGCWNITSLGRVASGVGNPIMTDLATYNMDKVSYARMLVDVDIAQPLVRELEIELPSGESFLQKVVFEFEPMFCSRCCIFGHRVEGCGAEKFQQKAEVLQKSLANSNPQTRPFVAKANRRRSLSAKGIAIREPSGGTRAEAHTAAALKLADKGKAPVVDDRMGQGLPGDDEWTLVSKKRKNSRGRSKSRAVQKDTGLPTQCHVEAEALPEQQAKLKETTSCKRCYGGRCAGG